MYIYWIDFGQLYQKYNCKKKAVRVLCLNYDVVWLPYFFLDLCEARDSGFGDFEVLVIDGETFTACAV